MGIFHQKAISHCPLKESEVGMGLPEILFWGWILQEKFENWGSKS